MNPSSKNSGIKSLSNFWNTGSKTVVSVYIGCIIMPINASGFYVYSLRITLANTLCSTLNPLC